MLTYEGHTLVSRSGLKLEYFTAAIAQKILKRLQTLSMGKGCIEIEINWLDF